MDVPEGAQRSEDGKWWWDGTDWQPVEGAQSTAPAEGQLSEDGKWRWDGSDWQPIDNGQDQPVDWSQFPELARVLQYGTDVDVYLQDLGVDPTVMSDDEPFANA
jgi:hypothetical protein